MDLISGWVLWVWLVVLAVGVVTVAALRRVRRRSGARDRVPLAGTSALETLPRYSTLRRRYRALSAALGLGLVVVLGGAVLLSARPAGRVATRSQQSNRDIVLCLDVSNSMNDLDVALVGRFEQLARQLRGQRIALTIFDAGAVLKFPLTDDQAYIAGQLGIAAKALGPKRDVEWFIGTLDVKVAQSAIGDGLVSCAGAFDDLKHKRARSMIVATDAEPGPGSIYSIAQGGAQARKSGARIYVLSRVTPQHPDLDFDPVQYRDLAAAAVASKGSVYDASDRGAVSGIVAKVLAQQASQTKPQVRTTEVDQPRPWAIAALLGLSVFVLAAWRARR